MWDILLQNSPRTSSTSPGGGLFDASFYRDAEEPTSEKETVETEIFHHSTRTVDTSDGGQALPPYSSAIHCRRPSSKDPDHDVGTIGDQESSTIINSSEYHVPSLPETMMWPGPGFRGDVSLMDITHDPFFQFHDHQSPYLGVWEIGNL
jgi:hypothetical protein